MNEEPDRDEQRWNRLFALIQNVESTVFTAAIMIVFFLFLLLLVSGCSHRAPILPRDEVTAAQEAIQQAREDHGLPYLALSKKLELEAQGHSRAMQAARRLWHMRPPQNGAENIARGQETGAEVVDAWMHSSGHRRNILGPYTHAGLGRAGNYWCLRLQRKDGDE